jgi:hypothetical protein
MVIAYSPIPPSQANKKARSGFQKLAHRAKYLPLVRAVFTGKTPPYTETKPFHPETMAEKAWP